VLFGPALLWTLAALGGLAWTAADASAWRELDRHGAPVAGSDACRDCHPQEWTSWHRSWHRTMTQRPSPAGDGPLAIARLSEHAEPGEGRRGQAGVLAPFAGEQLDYGGFRATMDRTEAGVPRIRVERLDAEGTGTGVLELEAEVALSVGSHRYQQYVAYLDRGGGPGELWRLPVAWHRAEQRWIHMNGAFVEPEGEAGSLADYERHLSRWNDNCIFCHNTEPVPGVEALAEGPRPRSEVGELGIACEACHGPAQAHLERHRQNPLRRMLASAAPGTDGSITNPAGHEPRRETEICGRCHGQRIARNIAAVMEAGDGFVPGDDLGEVSRPIFADTTIPGVAGLDEGRPFGPRFWPDGTPRLSAYEYQALLLSPCWDEGEGLGCGHCHDMHGDDPDGQLRVGRAGEGACVGCHAEGADGLPVGHGGHGEAVDCLDCHMPRVTYGLLEGMLSHRITSPDPAVLIGRSDQPDACTQCHTERSRGWAAASMERLGLRGSSPAGTPHPDEALASRVVLDLLGGDPIQRNLAADALAQPGATGAREDRMAWIAEGLEDEYPSVRWFAWRGLRSLARELPPAQSERREALLAALAAFDYLGPIDERVEAVSAVRALLGPPPLADAPEVRERLLADRQALAIWIGE
jgi:predicted CXXCH cytochrome family protein